jgi:hypothetical protein
MLEPQTKFFSSSDLTLFSVARQGRHARMTRRRGQGIVWFPKSNFIPLLGSDFAVTLNQPPSHSQAPDLLRRDSRRNRGGGHDRSRRPDRLDRRTARPTRLRCLATAFVLLCFAPGSSQRLNAQEAAAAFTADSPAMIAGASFPPAGLDLTPQAASPEPPLLARWWFWTAVGAIAVATVAVIVGSSRGSALPATNLGNQVFAP